MPKKRGKPLNAPGRLKAGDPGVVSTNVDLAKACGYSDRQTLAWRRQPDFPVNSDGSFSVWAVAQWHAARHQPKPPKPDAPDSPSLEKSRHEDAQIKRLKRLQMEGQLIGRAFVNELLTSTALHLRRAGEQIKTVSPMAAELLAAALDEIERTAARWIEDQAKGTA